VLSHLETFEHSGIITKVTGLVMESVGMHWPIGSPCSIPLRDGSKVEAEVVGFDGNRLLLMPQSSVEGIAPGAKVMEIKTAAWSLSLNARARVCFLLAKNYWAGCLTQQVGRWMDWGPSRLSTVRRLARRHLTP
jgi:flagellar biosynthesis/type III secretory pathway ATPase